MKFFAIAAALVAAVAAAGYGEEACTVITVTETVTAPYHVPSAPSASGYSSLPPYPTSAAPYPTAPAPYPTAPAPSGTGAASPSGTGAYTPAPPEFTGAASHAKVGGLVAGVGAIAALFL
ncbi:hypothetical protein BDV96DRAFT_653857 [Lophiotrema nucula]|uniref:Uncharacterized protein n=1 Tax=Lophiotrema nucula TaxID=690887 RepID=A0A6A5YKM7_9PLEO|nr:hypothetical protein BDV96DRAFT_653857 [Lophiotrema nucula]